MAKGFLHGLLGMATGAVAKAGEIAAPVIGAAIGGPVGAAAGKAVAGGIALERKRSAAKASSANSIQMARTQDRQRMADQYGISQEND